MKAKLKILVTINEKKKKAISYRISTLPLIGFILCLRLFLFLGKELAQYQTSTHDRQRGGISGGERNAKTICREELFL